VIRADESKGPKAKASFRVAGSRKSTTARGRRTVRGVIKGGSRSDRVVVRYVRGGAKVRVVVPLGKTIKAKAR
jgi:hypothetical protein